MVKKSLDQDVMQKNVSQGLLNKKTMSCLVLVASFFVCMAVLYILSSNNDDSNLQKKNLEFEEIETSLQLLGDDAYQTFFDTNIDTIYKNKGINGMVDEVTTALAVGRINMFVCHSLAHNIGHYAGYPDSFKKVEEFTTKENLDFCGSGFMHGVEGQLANGEYPSNIEKLYQFCKLSMQHSPYYGGCYHGAGHSFMENIKNPTEALAQCDLLKTDEVVDVFDCYRGVFAEHANLARITGKQPTYILEYCSSLSSELQRICGLEINGLELASTATTEEVGIALSTCMGQLYTIDVQKSCIQSVSGVATDHILGQDRRIVPPDIVSTLSDDFFFIYLDAIYGAFIKTVAYDTSKKLDYLCDSFVSSHQKGMCVEQIMQ